MTRAVEQQLDGDPETVSKIGGSSPLPRPAVLNGALGEPGGATTGRDELSLASISALSAGVGAGDDVASVRRIGLPRRRLFDSLLTGLLTAVYAASLVAGGRASVWRPAVLVLALALAITARLLYESPLPAPLRRGKEDDLYAAGRAALVAAVLGWVAVELLGLPHHAHQLALGCLVPWLILMTSRPFRKAELAFRRTGGGLFFVGTDAQLQELGREVTEHRCAPLIGHRAYQTVLSAEDLEAAVRDTRATMLVLSDEAIRVPTIVQAAVGINLSGVRVRDLRSFYEQEFDKVAVSDLTLSWFLFDVASIHRHRVYGPMKRGVEALVALVVLALSAPLVPLIVAAIKLSSRGPMLFRQQRVGRDGEIFTLTKFRTMHTAHGAEHGEWAGASAGRLFQAGRVLRRLHLDELPQLVSVVKGDLSLVGPRPEQPEIVARLERTMRFYHARHAVRPGLTGWAQVNMGYGGSESGSLAKLQFDLYYIKRQSLALDVRIMALTARKILFGGWS